MKMLRAKVVLWVLLSVVVVGGGYYVARYHVWAGYRNWSIGRLNGMARDFVARQDPRNALLTVRKVLSSRPNDAEAWQIGVLAADMNGSNEAVLFQRNLVRVRKTTANQLELMRLALKYEVYAFGLDAVKNVGPDALGRAEYHRLAAELYRRVHRDLPAKYHLISLLSLQPDDRAAQLGLAEIELALDGDRLPADWNQRVDALTAHADTALPATLLQLRAAVARKAAPDAAALAEKIQLRPELALEQRLQVLEAMELYDGKAADKLRAELQRGAATAPGDVVKVTDFFVQRRQPERARAWYAQLSEEIRGDEQVKLAVARALMAIPDWNGMEGVLSGTAWKSEEYQRLSLLAWAYRANGRLNQSADTWRVAVIAAGQDARKLTQLLRSVEAWQWEAERYELLSKLFNQMPGNAAVQQFLVAREYREGNTVNLNKIYARMIEANVADDAARNNFAYTSLLLDTNPGRAQTIAQELFKKDPTNVSFRTTYSLALHKQGHSAEALALIAQLDPATRATPVPMLHEAVYAAASGEVERAAGLIPEVTKAHLLPEQRQLATVASVAIAKWQSAQGRQSELVALGGTARGAGGWLALLPARNQSPTVDQQLADSYVREGQWGPLQELLRGGRWSDADHLRHALLARAEREQAHDAGAREGWRQAVATAGRDLAKLHELETLAERWQWKNERMEISARLFEREPGDKTRLAELLDYYRANARTPEMARVLWLFVNQTNATGNEAAWCVYYSLLCGLNVSPAQTLASRAFGSAPDNPRHRVAYAFALWRQQRPEEALKLLREVDASAPTGMQVDLLEAGVLLELGRKDEAKKILAAFTPANAVPEELNLAATLFRQAGLTNAVNAYTLQ